MPVCSVCETEFEQRFSFQAAVVGGVTRHFCSQKCRVRAQAAAAGDVVCSACGKPFRVVYAYQSATIDGAARHFCSLECRTPAVDAARRARTPVRRIAVLNQKGGTGKTTTTVNLAAGLAAAGHRTLLVDVDVQGNVGISLGIPSPPHSLADVLTDEGRPAVECIVPARENLDLLAGGPGLQAIEVELARYTRERPESLLRQRLEGLDGYAFVIIDCGPARTLLNQNALYYADQVLIPVGCDFLSLVGVKQILETLRQVNVQLSHPVSVLGVVPTFYDVRNRISHEVVRTLRRYFRDKVTPPVRVNTRLKEAPAHKQTIFEYDARSRGAEDYRRLVRCIVEERWDNEFPDLAEPPEGGTPVGDVL
jgi:chromosome partitioning protein